MLVNQLNKIIEFANEKYEIFKINERAETMSFNSSLQEKYEMFLDKFKIKITLFLEKEKEIDTSSEIILCNYMLCKQEDFVEIIFLSFDVLKQLRYYNFIKKYKEIESIFCRIQKNRIALFKNQMLEKNNLFKRNLHVEINNFLIYDSC